MGITSSFSLTKPVTDFFSQQFERWLARRVPSQSEHQLNSKNIMIYPTRFGLGYIIFIILLFILGTNYQNNIILLFSYLLASLFISVMLHSFYNFSQLQFYSRKTQQGYAGESIRFPIYLTANKIHYDLNIHFTQAKLKTQIERVAQCTEGTQEISLAYKAEERGLFSLGRVTVFSEYSFGLFKSKAVLDFGHEAIVYPKPISLLAGQYQFSAQPEDTNFDSYQTNNTVGTDDFFELKTFIKGESRARTAWKQLAKGQGHYSKHYQASQGTLQWLSLDDMPSNDIETKLGYLCFLIDELSASNQKFGLLLSSKVSQDALNIEPSSGFEHQQACLTKLALYS